LERKEPRGPQPIGAAIRSFLREGGLRRPPQDRQTFNAWIDAAGPDWSARAQPVAFRAGQLTVEVDGSVQLHELRGFHGEGIRERANAALGERMIRKVVYKLRG